MKIAIDKNILFAEAAFSTLGEVTLLEQENIKRENIKNFDALIIRSTTKADENLLRQTNVKFVGSAVIGEDHIDAQFLQEAGIAFSSAAGCNSQSVVEYVITAIFAYCEKEKLLPQNLTVAIIGAGNIGSLLAKKLNALQIKCLCNDPILEKKQIPKNGVFYSLDHIAQNCDVITLHVPLTKTGEHKTLNLLDEDFFAKIKRRALLIQASRGKVLDENALLKTCRESPDLNTVIDVWADEPDINTDLAKAKNRLFCTPHVAGHSFDGKINGTKIIYGKCREFFARKANPIFDFEGEILSKIRQKTIGYDKSLSEILLKACPIDRDSRVLETLFSQNANERKAAFVNLRKNYPERLEFGHFAVKNAPENAKETLQILGFSV